jgi:uncharacterized protein involved in exopolysaccharide biosynthesis
MTQSPEPHRDDINLLDLLQVFADNLRLIVLGSLAAGLLALGYTFTIAPTFTATTRFLPPQQQQSAAASMLASLGALGGLAGSAAGIKNPADQYVAFLESRSMQDVLVDRFKLMERFSTPSKENARRALGGSVSVTAGRDGLITIDASATDPTFAADIANAHVEELGHLLSRLAVTEAQQRRMFFEKQLNETKDKLNKADQALKASGINSNILKTNPATATASLASLKAGITAQEIKLASMRGYLTESAPDFRQARIELSAMRAQLNQAEKEEPTTASANGDYISKYRDYKYHETLFELFTKQYEIARVDEGREGAVIQVLDAAIPPEFKSKPQKAKIAMVTTLAAALALFIWAYLRHTLRNAANRPQSAARMAALKASLAKALWR